MNPCPTTGKPLPDGIGGFQALRDGETVQQGDLLVFNHGVDQCMEWASAEIGQIVEELPGYRVYREIPVAKAGSSDGYTDPEKVKAFGGMGRREPVIEDYKPRQPITGTSALKDSGARREFSTGSVRDKADGKGTPHLLPFRAITLASKQFERGMVKYGARNWEKGQPLSSYFDSMHRHAVKHWLGYTDEPHLDALVWNALAYAETAERIRLGILPPELDDRPEIGRATVEEVEA